jgi:hypothetical protein
MPILIKQYICNNRWFPKNGKHCHFLSCCLMKKETSIITVLLLIICGNIVAQGFNVYADFPSGNISIEKLKNDTLWMHPDLRDTRGDWFYWCFAVEKAKDKNLTFFFTKPNVFTKEGPAISFDKGTTWKWLGGEAVKNEAFSYAFKTNDEVRFSMGMPYTKKQFDLFIKPFLESGYVTLDNLTKTKSGRGIERLTIKPKNGEVKYKVLITARHHACEMMANYEIEGIIKEILMDEWLKNNIEFCIIPFIDKDGVERGDQGKNRIPHDHNRDYNDTSIYESTVALKGWIPGWAEKKLVVALDLHCPWIKGEYHENILVVGSADEKIAEQEKLFCRILKSTNMGELKVSEKMYMPYGIDWNTAEGYKEGLTFGKWMSTIEGIKLPIALEFPYAINEGQIINQENSRNFGIDLAKAIKKYLMQL